LHDPKSCAIMTLYVLAGACSGRGWRGLKGVGPGTSGGIPSVCVLDASLSLPSADYLCGIGGKAIYGQVWWLGGAAQHANLTAVSSGSPVWTEPQAICLPARHRAIRTLACRSYCEAVADRGCPLYGRPTFLLLVPVAATSTSTHHRYRRTRHSAFRHDTDAGAPRLANG
jgi:hypothetical protein